MGKQRGDLILLGQSLHTHHRYLLSEFQNDRAKEVCFNIVVEVFVLIIAYILYKQISSTSKHKKIRMGERAILRKSIQYIGFSKMCQFEAL